MSGPASGSGGKAGGAIISAISATPLCCTVAAFAAPLVAATVGAGALVFSGTESPEKAPGLWLTWWTSNAIGALFVLPLLLAAPDLWARLRRATARDCIRGALLLGLAAVAITVIFSQPGGGRYLFALLPLLVLATAWFDAPGARLLAFLLAVSGTYAAGLGRGPLATGLLEADLLTGQLFLSAVALTALLLPPIHNRKNLLRPLPLTLLLGGWALSGLVFDRLLNEHKHKDQADFAQLVANAEAVIENRMVNYVAVLRSARGFVLGLPTVTSADWRDFV